MIGRWSMVILGKVAPVTVWLITLCMVITYSRVWINPVFGMVGNPARGQLKGKMNICLFPFAPENLASRDRSGRPVSRKPARSRHSG